jgi:hypothetical protein
MPIIRTALARSLERPWWWFGLGAILLLIQISPWWWTPNIDATAYLSIARNLAAGRLADLGRAQLFFAPGYPLLISPLFLLSDRPFLLIAIFHWLLALALMIGIYRWARRLTPAADPRAALAVTMLVMVNVSLWEFYRQSLSEFAFTVLLIWAAHLLDRALAAAPGGGARLQWLILGSVLAALTALTRQTGGVLVIGFGLAVLAAAWRRRWNWPAALIAALFVGAIASAPVLATMLYERAHALPGSKTYTDFLRDPALALSTQLTEGLRLRIYEVGRLILPGMFGAYSREHRWFDPNTAFYVPTFLLLAYAWCRRLRTAGLDTLNLAWPVYLIFYMVWPFDQSTRFMMPMLPVLCLLVWDLAAGAGRFRGCILTALVVAHLVVALGAWATTLPKIRRENTQTWGPMTSLAAPIRANVQPVATFLAHRQQYYLMFLIDRRVEPLDSLTAIGPANYWLLTRTNDPIPEGFTPRQTAGDFRLLERLAAPSVPAN